MAWAGDGLLGQGLNRRQGIDSSSRNNESREETKSSRAKWPMLPGDTAKPKEQTQVHQLHAAALGASAQVNKDQGREEQMSASILPRT